MIDHFAEMKILLFIFKCIWKAKDKIRSSIYSLIFRLLPGVFFDRLGKKCTFWGWPHFGTIGNKNISIGNGCHIGREVFFSAGPQAKVLIGNGCSLNTGCHIVSLYGISIGDKTRIGEYVSIRDQNHSFGSIEELNSNNYTGGVLT